MTKNNFVKLHAGLDQITGNILASIIVGNLEYWFDKKTDGFYKFIEPCSHRLYKKGDSWLEESGISGKRFARAFDKIGTRHRSLSAFEQAEDKFEGKLYASYYNRHTNQMFFVRNHELANEILNPFFKAKKENHQPQQHLSTSAAVYMPKERLGICHNGRSYIEAKSTTNKLSKDNSHASDEIVKKMSDIWTAIVEHGKGRIELTRRRIAFLKQAFKDKFGSNLENWKKYCEDIASSGFLMGKIKASFRATLDWALKFDNIVKVLEGNYGIKRPSPTDSLPSHLNLQEEIVSSKEIQKVKEFRGLCLRRVGNAKYISYFKNLNIELDPTGKILLTAQHKFAADDLDRNCNTYLRLILDEFGQGVTSITILSPGDSRGRLIEKKRISNTLKTLPNTQETSLFEQAVSSLMAACN